VIYSINPLKYHKIKSKTDNIFYGYIPEWANYLQNLKKRVWIQLNRDSVKILMKKVVYLQKFESGKTGTPDGVKVII
jgi:hypothetical protein